MLAIGAENGENIGRHPHVVAVHAVVNQHIAGDVHVGAVAIVNAEDGDGIGEGDVLPVGFGNTTAIGGWVVDGKVINLIHRRGNRRVCRFADHSHCSGRLAGVAQIL